MKRKNFPAEAGGADELPAERAFTAYDNEQSARRLAAERKNDYLSFIKKEVHKL